QPPAGGRAGRSLARAGPVLRPGGRRGGGGARRGGAPAGRDRFLGHRGVLRRSAGRLCLPVETRRPRLGAERGGGARGGTRGADGGPTPDRSAGPGRLRPRTRLIRVPPYLFGVHADGMV